MKRLTRVFSLGSVGVIAEDARLTPGRGESAAWRPPIDIFERLDGIVIVVELPGVDRDHINVSVERGILSITGFRRKYIPKNTERVHQMEIPDGPFERKVQLPDRSDVDHIEAEYREDSLTIEIPNKES